MWHSAGSSLSIAAADVHVPMHSTAAGSDSWSFIYIYSSIPQTSNCTALGAKPAAVLNMNDVLCLPNETANYASGCRRRRFFVCMHGSGKLERTFTAWCWWQDGAVPYFMPHLSQQWNVRESRLGMKMCSCVRSRRRRPRCLVTWQTNTKTLSWDA